MPVNDVPIVTGFAKKPFQIAHLVLIFEKYQFEIFKPLWFSYARL